MKYIISIIFILFCIGKWTEVRNKQKADAYLANKYDEEVKGK